MLNPSIKAIKPAPSAENAKNKYSVLFLKLNQITIFTKAKVMLIDKNEIYNVNNIPKSIFNLFNYELQFNYNCEISQPELINPE